MLNGLDLFSGYGGISYALRDYVRPIAYCEIDPYCQGILLSRISDRQLPKPILGIWDDIRTFDGRIFKGSVDIVYGGFPCQDISVAGHGKGLGGERSGLVFEMLRLAKEIQPEFLFFENVPAITSRGGLQLVRAIAEMGYDCRWCVIPAAAVGAPHRRERWWLLAKRNGERWDSRGDNREERPFQSHKERHTAPPLPDGEQSQFDFGSLDSISPDASSERRQQVAGGAYGDESENERGSKKDMHKLKCLGQDASYWQETEPPVCGVDDGPPNRVDRIRALGNGVVPQQAKEAFETLMGLK